MYICGFFTQKLKYYSIYQTIREQHGYCKKVLKIISLFYYVYSVIPNYYLRVAGNVTEGENSYEIVAIMSFNAKLIIKSE